MNRAERIEQVLRAELAPQRLVIEDQSSLHAGHAGAHPEGETHFAVTVVSAAFDSVGRVERQRRINGLLAAEFDGGLHALSITARTPAEDSRYV
jgi:BolA protein